MILLAACGKDSPTEPDTPPPVPSRIVLSPASAMLTALGETIQLGATVLDQHGAGMQGARVSWSSGDITVATVSEAGLVTAIGNGTTQISARSGGISASTAVTVTQSATRIMVTPTAPLLTALGHTVQLSAAVNDRDDKPVTAANLTWSSEDPSVATVSMAGLVTAAGNGATRIIVRSGSLSASANVTVSQTAKRIEITPPSVAFSMIGDTRLLTAAVYDGNDNVIPDAPVTWSTSDDGVAAVTSDGTVTATGNGDAQVSVMAKDDPTMAEDVSASIPVSVVDLSVERSALESLYHATDGPNWIDNTNWLSDRPFGEWYGVSTDSDGRVIRLRFVENNMRGPLTTAWGELDRLTHLEVFTSNVRGQIPPSIGQLANLQVLDLRENLLSGAIPPELGELTNLVVLTLRHNELSESIPSELGRLDNLTAMSIHGNRLSGPIPGSLGQLANLEWMNLEQNELTGPIPPELGALSRLRSMGLQYNQLSGPLPPSLGQMVSLEQLDLESNDDLSGPLPQSFTNLENLERLKAKWTGLCVPLTDAFQAWLRGLSDPGTYISNCVDPDPDRKLLTALYDETGGMNWTTNTNWLSPEPIGEWFGITTNADGRVTELALADNNLEGPVPSAIGSLSQLTDLDLSGNRLTGPVPVAMSRLTDLVTLDLHDNAELSGPLPQSLIYLDLRRLRTDGTVLCAPLDASFQAWLRRLADPETSVANCADTVTDPEPDRTALVAFYHDTGGPGWKFQFNWLSSEPLDTWHGVWTNENGRVSDLVLVENQLEGPIPWELSDLSELNFLGLDRNDLSGPIPTALGNLSELYHLSLSYNQLLGSLPPALGRLSNLEYLNLSNNRRLSGPVPREYLMLTYLERLLITGTRLCIPADDDFQSWKDGMLTVHAVDCAP